MAKFIQHHVALYFPFEWLDFLVCTLVILFQNHATDVVRRNWFEVTSDPQVNEQRVKAYIKALQGLPSCSIDRIVNMTDENVSDSKRLRSRSIDLDVMLICQEAGAIQ